MRCKLDVGVLGLREPSFVNPGRVCWAMILGAKVRGIDPGTREWHGADYLKQGLESEAERISVTCASESLARAVGRTSVNCMQHDKMRVGAGRFLCFPTIVMLAEVHVAQNTHTLSWRGGHLGGGHAPTRKSLAQDQ